MTNLSGPSTSISSTFGDLLTTTNNGGGLTATLEPVQDGFGNTSAIELSTEAFNVTGELQISGTALTVTADEINAIADPGGSVFNQAVTFNESVLLNGDLTLDSGFSYFVSAFAEANPTITNGNCIIHINFAGAVSVVLPTPDEAGRFFIIKDGSGNASANHITITVEGGGTIDGQASYTINANYGFIQVYGIGLINSYFIVSSQGVVTP